MTLDIAGLESDIKAILEQNSNSASGPDDQNQVAAINASIQSLANGLASAIMSNVEVEIKKLIENKLLVDSTGPGNNGAPVLSKSTKVSFIP